jgi:hypothetical protein
MTKQTFKCVKCGDEFEIEADHFIPGVSGRLYDGKGTLLVFVDPTENHKCAACVYMELVESGMKLMEESDEHD